MIADVFKAFKQGETVLNPEAWRKGLVTSDAVAAFLLSVVATVHDVYPAFVLDNAKTLLIAGAVYGVVRVVLAFVSDPAVGVPSSDSPPPASGGTVDQNGA